MARLSWGLRADPNEPWTRAAIWTPMKLAYCNPKLGQRTGLLWARRVMIGETGYSLCFVLDISARKEMEEELGASPIGRGCSWQGKKRLPGQHEP